MAASVLALPSQQWQPACWLTHLNYDGSQRAGFPSDNGSQQAGFHCLLSQARVVEFVPDLLQGADIAHRNARLRENQRTMFEV